jgi:predicted peptidase
VNLDWGLLRDAQGLKGHTLGMRFQNILTAKCIAILLCISCQSDQGVLGTPNPPQLVTYPTSVTLAGKALHYRVSLPDEASRPDAGWPLLLFLHGSGERGTDIAQLEVHGPLRLVGDIPELSQCVIVVPQCPQDAWWEPEPLKTLIDEVRAVGGIDDARIYVTGLSMGGYGTWGLLARYPGLFAGAIPICGGGDVRRIWKGMPSHFELEKLLQAKAVPIHAFHGEEDNTVPVEESRLLIDALTDVGSNAQLTAYPGVGHDSWTQTYAEPALYKWLFAQSL